MTILTNNFQRPDSLSPDELYMFLEASGCHEISEKRTIGFDNDNDRPPSKRFRKDGMDCVRRVPCKARGLSPTHNPETAYLEVPTDAPHGLILSCSHPQCQASGGSRFRFCKVCNVPVAKRNFLRRHGHGLVESNQELKEEVDNIVRPTSKTSRKASSPPSPPRSMDQGTLHLKAATTMPVVSHTHLTEEEMQWLALLRSRPKIQEMSSMTYWINQVVAFIVQKRQSDAESESTTIPTATPKVDDPSVPPPRNINSFFDAFEPKKMTSTDVSCFGPGDSASLDAFLGDDDSAWFPSYWR